MVRISGGLVLLALLATALARPPLPIQHVLDVSDASTQESKPRRLQGRFLHITDLHPDPFYRPGSDPEGEYACHRGEGRAGYFGAEKTECDSPFSLINATFDWIKLNIRDDIDFVVWTGDSARHDNDEKHPRSIKQVEQLNQYIVSKFDDVFGTAANVHGADLTGDHLIPIVPTFGNNDILPHNIFEPGPNRWTREYLRLWDKFIPQEQRHSFARGGWFFTEVIPNKLAIFSLNTLYFFDSNAAVDGCDDKNEPGYEHFEWLRIQLEFLRQRKMKAILMGHVPPARTESKQSWDESCYQKYTLWLRQYRDVIVGNLFGHMNIDHFILQDVKQLTYKWNIAGIDDNNLRPKTLPTALDRLHVEAKSDYLSDLRDLWGSLPTPPSTLAFETEEDTVVKLRKNKKGKKSKKKKKLDKYLKEIGGPFAERFSLSCVSPSVVPNFYPTLRIIHYNITGLENDHPALMPLSTDYSNVEQPGNVDLSNADYETDKKKDKHKKKTSKKPKPDFPLPKPPSTTSSPGPAYSPQTFSFLSWEQLYANLTKINEAVTKEIEQEVLGRGREEIEESQYEKILKEHFDYELEYDTRTDKAYKLKDLTVRSWVSLAEKIGRAQYDPLEDDMESAGESSQFSTSKLEISGVVDSIMTPPISLDVEDANEQNDPVQLDEFELDRICLEWLKRHEGQAISHRNTPNDPPWPDYFFHAFTERIRFLEHRPQDLISRIADDETDSSDSDEGYQSLTEDEFSDHEDNDENTDSGFEEGLDTLKRKKKHKKGKKGSDEIMKKNKLWHMFVKRAFVLTKTDADLEDEFG